MSGPKVPPMTAAEIEAELEACVAAELSMLPICHLGNKAPFGGSQQFQDYKINFADSAQVKRWLSSGDYKAWCFLAVKGVAFLDFDRKYDDGAAFKAWWAALPPELQTRLVVERTQSDGIHVLFKQRQKPMRAVLAHAAEVQELNAKTSKMEPVAHALIEFYSDGQPCLCSPSPRYLKEQGHKDKGLPEITDAELALMFQLAIDQNKYFPESGKGTAQSAKTGQPGTDFNQKMTQADFIKLLEEDGWSVSRLAATPDENTHLARWGKEDKKATSATIRLTEQYGWRFYCFTSSAPPFTSGDGYSPFAVLTLIKHKGDYKACAKSLRAAGFGKEGEEDSSTQSAKLLQIAADWELFHSPDGTHYVTQVYEDGRRMTRDLGSKEIKAELSHTFYVKYGKAPGTAAVNESITVLRGLAQFKGEEHDVFTRLGTYAGHIYIDLGDKSWDALCVTPTGWHEVSSKDVPVYFRRPGGLLSMPRPLAGGDLNKLRPHFNLKDDAQWHLLVGWLIGTMHPSGPYCLLDMHGEQGAAKSTACKMLRKLIDPNVANLRAAPKNQDDLMIAARNGRVCAFDNLSYVPEWLSDALCRLATGGGLSKREHYSNDGEIIFDSKRPTILNGIVEVVKQSDIIDRSILVELLEITEAARLSEIEVWAAFDRDHASILGGLLTAISCAMKNLEATTKAEKWRPRMADFYLWVTAAEPALGWPSGTFKAAYSKNRTEATKVALDASPVWIAIKSFLADKLGVWQGSAFDLLALLNARKANSAIPNLFTAEKPDPHWPTRAEDLSRSLKRLAPNMRMEGIEVGFSRSSTTRTISLRDMARQAATAA